MGSPRPAFEVATIRPDPEGDPQHGQWSIPNTGNFKASHLPLTWLIRLAYNIDARQIVNSPGWLSTNLYDVNAKPEDGVKLTREELRPRLQQLLAERFHLVCHIETREQPGMILVAGKHGTKLTPTLGAPFPDYRTNVSPGHMQVRNLTMANLAAHLTELLSTPVADRTGITGSFDISFDYARDDDTTSNLPTLLTALEENCGLRLTAAKVPVQVLVIDSVSPDPTPN